MLTAVELAMAADRRLTELQPSTPALSLLLQPVAAELRSRKAAAPAEVADKSTELERQVREDPQLQLQLAAAEECERLRVELVEATEAAGVAAEQQRHQLEQASAKIAQLELEVITGSAALEQAVIALQGTLSAQQDAELDEAVALAVIGACCDANSNKAEEVSTVQSYLLHECGLHGVYFLLVAC